MKKKISYITITAAVAVTAFFIGKATIPQPETIQIETVQLTSPEISPEAQEITDLTVTEYGLQVTFGDNTGVFVDTESLEKAGLIDTANIVDWNTDGEELAVITKNDYEYYAYKSADIYQNRAFVPVTKTK